MLTSGQKQNAFHRLARLTERLAGSATTFLIAVGLVLGWLLTGPFFDWSDTWQLMINTATSIATFLMVFLIQSTQTRDTQALHLKLDELIRVNHAARNSLLNVEEMPEAEVAELKGQFNEAASTNTNGI